MSGFVADKLVSVIIPNYNHARFLDQRIQSVLNQSYKNIEVIILDDKSSDNSLDVISKYRNDPRVSQIVVNEINSGNTFKQWEKGIDLAKGELVWIAESDDYCELNMLEELVNAFYRHEGTALAYSTLTYVDEHGNQISWYKTFRNKYLSSEAYLKRYLTLGNMVRNASCAIFSRQAAIDIEHDFVNYPGAGDYLFWVRIASKGRVAIVNKNLSYFRRYSGVITDRCNSDGSNFQAEYSILNVISSYVHISDVRRVIIFSDRARRLSWIPFDNPEIKNRIWALWHIQLYSCSFYKLVCRIASSLRLRFNIYI